MRASSDLWELLRGTADDLIMFFRSPEDSLRGFTAKQKSKEGLTRGAAEGTLIIVEEVSGYSGRGRANVLGLQLFMPESPPAGTLRERSWAR